MRDEPINVLATTVLPADAHALLANLLTLARDQQWSDARIAHQAQLLLEEWRNRDLHQRDTLEDVRHNYNVAREDNERTRDALLPLLPDVNDLPDARLRAGHVAEQAARRIEHLGNTVADRTGEAHALAEELTRARADVDRLGRELAATQRQLVEQGQSVISSQKRAVYEHREALRAIGLAEEARQGRREAIDALTALEMRVSEQRLELRGWREATGMDLDHAVFDPQRAVNWHVATWGREMIQAADEALELRPEDRAAAETVLGGFRVAVAALNGEPAPEVCEDGDRV